MSVISQSNDLLSSDKSPSKEDIVDLLADETVKDTDKNKVEDDKDEPVEEVIEDDDDEDTDDKDDEEDKEEEDKDEEDNEEDLLADKEFELVVPVPKKVILAKYPELFKEFPHLEVAYYRDRQFVEIFPTVDDAKAAVSKANTLDQFDQDLMQGNTEPILKAVKGSNEEAFNNLVDNYLPNLAKVDEKAYIHVTGNIIKEVIAGLVARSKNTEGDEAESLYNAAVTLNKAVFNSNKYEEPKKLGKGTSNTDNEEAVKLKKERESFDKQRFETSVNDSFTRIRNVIQSTVDKNIDKLSVMTPYIRKNAVKDVMESLSSHIDNDSTFKRTVIEPMLKKAASENYSRSSMEKVEKAYLSRAKSILPKLIHSANKKATKGLGKNNSSGDKSRQDPIASGHSTSSNNRSGQSNRNSSKNSKEIPKGVSPRDFIMMD